MKRLVVLFCLALLFGGAFAQGVEVSVGEPLTQADEFWLSFWAAVGRLVPGIVAGDIIFAPKGADRFVFEALTEYSPPCKEQSIPSFFGGTRTLKVPGNVVHFTVTRDGKKIEDGEQYVRVDDKTCGRWTTYPVSVVIPKSDLQTGTYRVCGHLWYDPAFGRFDCLFAFPGDGMALAFCWNLTSEKISMAEECDEKYLVFGDEPTPTPTPTLTPTPTPTRTPTPTPTRTPVPTPTRTPIPTPTPTPTICVKEVGEWSCDGVVKKRQYTNVDCSSGFDEERCDYACVLGECMGSGGCDTTGYPKLVEDWVQFRCKDDALEYRKTTDVMAEVNGECIVDRQYEYELREDWENICEGDVEIPPWMIPAIILGAGGLVVAVLLVKGKKKKRR